MAQTVIVAVLVGACSLHAAWILAPAGARRSLARALLALPLPSRLATRLRKNSAAPSAGCACDGCDRAPAKKAPVSVAPIKFHRRLPR